MFASLRDDVNTNKAQTENINVSTQIRPTANTNNMLCKENCGAGISIPGLIKLVTVQETVH